MELVYTQHLEKKYDIYVWSFQEEFAHAQNHTQRKDIYMPKIMDNIQQNTKEMTFDVYYNRDGKPILNSKMYKSISISHTLNYVAVELHKEEYAGIDVETPRLQLIKVQHKFLNEDEINWAKGDVNRLCLLWTVKEATFKIYGQKHISLKNHIFVTNVIDREVFVDIMLDNHKENFVLHSYPLSNSLVISYVVSKN